MKKYLVSLLLFSYVAINAISTEEKLEQKKLECIALESQIKSVEKELEETRIKMINMCREIVNKQLSVENKERSEENLKTYGEKLANLMQKFLEDYVINKNIAFFDNAIKLDFTSLNEIDSGICKFYYLNLGFHAARIEVLLKRWGVCFQEFCELHEELEQKKEGSKS